MNAEFPGLVTAGDRSSSDEDRLVVAVDVGGTSMAGEVVDSSLRTLATATAPTPRRDGEATIRSIITLVNALTDQLSAADRLVCGIGLAVPGIVDSARGIVLHSANVGWRDTPVRDHVRSGVDLPVVLHHDVTAAGEAEFRLGAGRGTSNTLVVSIGTGIAAAIISDGRVLHGGLGQAGELGHIVVRPEGPLCSCGQRGCLEALASASAIARAYTAASGRVVDGAEDVWARLDTDPTARRVWNDAIRVLADGLLTASTLLAPDLIILGGGLAHAGTELLTPLEHQLAERAKVAIAPRIVHAHLGSRAGILGAALRAWDHLDRVPGASA